MSSAGGEEPRRRLHHEQVVAAAEAIVDELGWDGLTMAALAAHLGTKAQSLYNHVASLEALRSELQQRTLALLGRTLSRAAMGRTGRDGFLELTRRFRDFVQRHPHRYDGMTRAPIDWEGFVASSVDANAALSAVVRSYGVGDDRLLLTQVSVFGALHGVVSLEINRYFGDFVDYDELYDTVVGAVEEQLAGAARAT